MSRSNSTLLGVIAALTLTSLGTPAAGASVYWDPGLTHGSSGGGSGTWNTNGTANWWVSGSSDSPWTDTTGVATAVFGGTAGTVTVSGNNTANALTFSTAGYTLSSGTVTLAGSSPTININATSGTIGSVLAGAGLTFAGNGTLYLSGSNTMSGTISFGSNSTTLVLGNNAALGSSGIGLNGNGGTLRATAPITLAGNIYSGDTLTVAGGNSITLSGIYTGYSVAGNILTNNLTSGTLTVGGNVCLSSGSTSAGGMTFNGSGNTVINGLIENYWGGSSGLAGSATYGGAGTVTVTAANAYTGTTNFGSNATTLVLGNNAALGSSAINLTGSSGTLQANTPVTLTNNISSSYTLTVAGNNSITLNGVYTGSSASGNILTNSLSSGTLTLGGNVCLSSGSTTAGGMTFNGSGNTVINGVIENYSGGSGGSAGNVTYSGVGTVTVTAANAYTGTTSFGSNATTLVLGNNAALGSSGIGMNGSSGTLQASKSVTLTNNIFSGYALTVAGSNSISLNGIYTGYSASGNILTNNLTSGTLTVGGNVCLSSGTGTAGGMTFNGSGNTVISGLLENYSGGSGGSAGSVTYGGAGTVTVTAANAYTGNSNFGSNSTTLVLGNNAALGSSAINLTGSSGTLQASKPITLTNNISSSYALTVTGSNSITLNGVYTGSSASGNILTNNLTSGTLTVGGNVCLSSGSATAGGMTFSGSGNTVINGIIENFSGGSGGAAGSVTYSSAGTVTVTAANAYTGTTSFGSSPTTLVVGNNAALGSSGLGLTGSSGTLQASTPVALTNNIFSGYALTVAGSNSISLNGVYTGYSASANILTNNLTSGTLTVGGNVCLSSGTGTAGGMTINSSGNTVISGVIANYWGGSGGAAGSVTYSGTGTVTLTAANAYTGYTNFGSSPTTLLLGNNAALGSSGLGLNGSSGTLQASTPVSLANSIYSGCTLTVAGSNSIALDGIYTGFSATANILTNNLTSGTLTVGGIVCLSSGSSTAGGMTFNGSGNTVVSGLIEDYWGGSGGSAGSVTCGGAGTVTLAAANAYTGNTLVTGYGSGYATHINLLLGSSSGTAISGNLTIGNNGAGSAVVEALAPNQFGPNSAVTLNTASGAAGNAYLILNGNNQTIAGLSSTGDVQGNAVVENSENAPAPGSATLTINNSANYTYAGLIRDNWNQNGTVALVKTGSGMQTLSGADTYTGGTTISGGTLAVGNASALGTGAASLNSGVLDLEGVNLSVGGLTGSGGTALTNSSAATPTLTVNQVSGLSTFGGTIANGLGTVSLAKSGSGTQVLTGGNTFSGLTTINGGTLQLGNGGNTGSIGVTSGVVDHGTLAFNRADNLTFAPIISGGGGVSQLGADTVTLSGNNSYSGNTTINSGSLVVSGTLGNTAVAVNSGAAMIVNGLVGSGGVTVSDGQLSGTGVIGGPVSVAGISAAAINLVDGTIGALTLSGAGTALTLGANATLDMELGTGTADLVNLTAGSLRLNDTVNINLATLAGATISAGTYNLVAFPGGLSGGGTFHLNPVAGLANSLVASLNNTGTSEQLIIALGIPASAWWTGTTSASWADTANWATDSAGTTAISLLPGSISDVYFTSTAGTNLATTLDRDFTVKSVNFTAASAAVTVSGSNTLTIATSAGITDSAATAQAINVPVALGAAQTWTVNGAAPLSVGGVISTGSSASGATGLTVAGTGTLLLTNANGYNGGTTVNSATLQLGDGVSLNGSVTGNIADNGLVNFANPLAQTFTGTISGTGSVLVSGSGVLTLTASHTYAGGTTIGASGTLQLGDGLTQNGSVTGNIVDNGVLNFNNLFSQSITGTISGSGGVAKTAGGTLVFVTAASYTGGTTITGGMLQYGTANALPTTGAVTVAGGQLDLGGTGGGNVGSVTLQSGLISGQSGDTLTGTSFNVQSGTVSASLAGASAGLTMTGPGTAVLSATNSYGGGTTVSGGLLQYGTANALPSGGAVTVSGGQLDLNGTTGGSVGSLTLQSGSIIGQNADTLSATSLNLQSGMISANLGDNGGTGLVKTTGGTVTLSGTNNTYAGGTSIEGGVLAISAAANLGVGNLTLGAGTLQTTGSYILDGALVTLTDAAAAIDVTGTNDMVTLSALVTGTGGLTKAGPGDLALANAAGNDYSGNTYVVAGKLMAQADNALSPNSNLVIGDGASVILDFGGGAGGTALAEGGTFSPAWAAPAISPAAISTVPEPGTWTLLLVAVISSLGMWYRRRK